MGMSKDAIGGQRELTYKALADSTRRHLLRLLDDAGSPLGVGVLAEQTGLHRNTIRDHLEMLRSAGLVTRTAEERDRPGRPKMLYSPAPLEARSPGFEGYRFLAEVLTGYMQANLDDPGKAAEEAGHAWGRYLVERPQPFAQPDSVRVVTEIVATLTALGFSPEEAESDGGFRVRLHDCPFREVATGRADIVCGVHLGLLRGMAEELGGSAVITSLEPFVEPSLCVIEIEARDR